MTTATHEENRKAFLPINIEDMKERGWDQLDFILVSPDAYVDHPSFGAALISRLLESRGYKVGLICQPNWNQIDDFKCMGRPKLGFLVSGGNMDSMVLHYTAARKPRSEDLYSPGKKTGLRPNRATIVYSAAIRQAYKKIPIIIGGIETSLRRMGHYDYWSDTIRRSILLDSKADLAVYGMGEIAIIEIADRLKQASEAGINPVNADLRGIRGTLYKLGAQQAENIPQNAIELPDYADIVKDKQLYAKSFGIQHRNTDPFSAAPLVEKYPGGEKLVQMPPSPPLDTALFDQIYELPYTRTYHPIYLKEGGIAALDEVKFSVISSRGCFGGCSFCALTFHQGRNIQARSHESIIKEVKLLSAMPDFKGYIHDVGGPTANFRVSACEKMAVKGSCTHKNCLAPVTCKNLKADHKDYLSLLRKLRSLPGIKKVFIRSGIRYDYLMQDNDSDFFTELVKHHISGQLKVAPEHVSRNVLDLMGKPHLDIYRKFQDKFNLLNKKADKRQFLVPYFISSHPGSTLDDAIELAEFLRDQRISPQQVQDFYPTPGTLSTCMYYSGYDPRDMKKIYTAQNSREKAMQRALLQYRKNENHGIVREALLLAGREDLIGGSNSCLIPHGERNRKKKVKK
ncbi:YgiQ family radical SAM protein [Spirochaeta dissipatitropha]